MDRKQPLKQRWLVFLSVVMDPWIAVLSVITAIIICMNAYNNDKQVITVILSLLTVFSSGIIGARLIKIWTDTLDKGLLAARGKTTIRDLVLLIENIGVIKKRIQIYIARQNEEQSKKATIISFEELIEKCNILEREVINSIESWSDIIPDADISVKLEDISLTTKYINKERFQKERLKEELEIIKARPDKEKEELRNIIIEKAKKIINLEKEIDRKVEAINSSTLGGINIYTLSKLSCIDKFSPDTP
ncbi:MAG: hypothetical protein PHC34_06590 [Candidatus Gastranaerophilales bacterium]|nr:hypothetical protein [Candidatus Gastranaerophilales bacterium]